MSLEAPSTVRLSEQAKDQLIRLKRLTGIKQWNVLCRWALSISLADPSPPLVRQIRADSNVEMSWKTFSGNCDLAFQGLLRVRMTHGGEGFETLTDLTLAHIHRGIGILAGDSSTNSVESLLLRATQCLSDNEARS